MILDFVAGGTRQLLKDLFSSLEASLAPGLAWWKALPPLPIGFVAAWMVYVPAHELLHAAGCVATGGTVTELRLAPMYGTAWLQKLFPFVVPSTEYAGRLSGFSTNGSDLCYLATDFAPYLLTVLVGVPLLRSSLLRPGRRAAASGLRVWLFGPAAVLAAAPLISITGDYFEMASVALTRAYAMAGVAGLEGLRSDDLFRLIAELWRGEVAVPAGGARRWIVAGSVITSSLVLSLCLVSWTHRAGMAVQGLIGRRRRAASAPPAPAR